MVVHADTVWHGGDGVAQQGAIDLGRQVDTQRVRPGLPD